MKLNRKLVLVLSLVLALALATGGTLAYLSDTDADVNTMTLGNVHIKQLEYERVPQAGHEIANDAWISTGETDKYDLVPDEVRVFSQGKPLYPAVFADGVIKWDDRAVPQSGDYYQSWQKIISEAGEVAPGSNQLFDDSVKNVIDKFVFVENTGKSDAYVRTWFAFEQGELTAERFDEILKTNGDADHWSWSPETTDVEIAGHKYVVCVATYMGPKSDPTGILAPGAITYPSLLQVYLAPEATNEDVEAIDADGNGRYDILVLSQAVQAAGFADAETALNEAFGEEHPWTEATEEDVKGPFFVYNTEELRAAMKIPGLEIYLGDDLIADDDKGTGYCYYAKYDCTINLNGHSITLDMPGKELYGVFYALNGAKVDIVGEGDIDIAGGLSPWIWSTGASGDTEVNIYGGNWTNNSPDFGKDYCEGLYSNKAGVINVYGGTFDWGSFSKYTVNESRNGVVNVYGGTFINFDPRVSHDSDGSYVAPGYKVVSETQDNGDVWYTVIPE